MSPSPRASKRACAFKTLIGTPATYVFCSRHAAGVTWQRQRQLRVARKRKAALGGVQHVAGQRAAHFALESERPRNARTRPHLRCVARPASHHAKRKRVRCSQRSCAGGEVLPSAVEHLLRAVTGSQPGTSFAAAHRTPTPEGGL